jgi:hypothetical protein
MDQPQTKGGASMKSSNQRQYQQAYTVPTTKLKGKPSFTLHILIYLKKSANQTQELPVVAMYVNRAELNEQSL